MGSYATVLIPVALLLATVLRVYQDAALRAEQGTRPGLRLLQVLRVLRVLRVETTDDVELLVRHVQRVRPSGENRIVVCIDDVVRARTGAWADAGDRLPTLQSAENVGVAASTGHRPGARCLRFPVLQPIHGPC